MSAQSHKTCRTCSFFDLPKGAAMNLKSLSGNCHRLPPGVHLIPAGHGPQPGTMQMAVQSSFPPVQADMWCGEHDDGLPKVVPGFKLLPDAPTEDPAQTKFPLD